MSDQLPIKPIQPTGPADIVREAKKNTDEDGPSFSDVLKNSIKQVNDLQKDADQAIQDLATGKTENFTEVLTAVEKADLAFRALMQIRNKLLDAYEEVNRLRV